MPQKPDDSPPQVPSEDDTTDETSASSEDEANDNENSRIIGRKFKLLRKFMRRNRRSKMRRRGRIPRRFTSTDINNMARYVQSHPGRITMNMIKNTKSKHIQRIVCVSGKTRMAVFYYIRKHRHNLQNLVLPVTYSEDEESQENDPVPDVNADNADNTNRNTLWNVITQQHRHILRLRRTNERLRIRFVAETLWTSESDEIPEDDSENVELPPPGDDPLVSIISNNTRQILDLEKSNVRIMTLLLLKQIEKIQTPEINFDGFSLDDFFNSLDDTENADCNSEMSIEDSFLKSEMSPSTGLSLLEPLTENPPTQKFSSDAIDDTENSIGPSSNPFENPVPSTSSGITKRKRCDTDNSEPEQKRLRFEYSLTDLFGMDSEEDSYSSSDLSQSELSLRISSDDEDQSRELDGFVVSSGAVELSKESSNQLNNPQSVSNLDNLSPEHLDINQNLLVRTDSEKEDHSKEAEKVDLHAVNYVENLKRYFSSLSNNSRPNNAYPIAEYQSCGDKNQNYPVENGLNTSSDSSENNNYMDKHSSSSTLTSDDSEDETSSDSTENNNM